MRDIFGKKFAHVRDFLVFATPDDGGRGMEKFDLIGVILADDLVEDQFLSRVG